MTTKPRKLSSARSQQLTKLMTVSKTATMTAVMGPDELAKIIVLVATDINKADQMAARFPQIWPAIAPAGDYYSLASCWFTSQENAVGANDLVDLLDFAESLDVDFMTYLKCLTELHKRRRKYGLILQRQPLPTMVQVSPRALMEYGPDFPTEALASWLPPSEVNRSRLGKRSFVAATILPRGGRWIAGKFSQTGSPSPTN
jgi:hypothetical protein